MYEQYFGLTEKPFSITPDPRFLYMSERHAEALAHLQYGVMESGGFIQLTGEVGTGKTTVTRSLLHRLPDEVDIAAILNPRVTVMEFLQTICEEFGIDLPDGERGNKDLIDRLNRYLLDCHANGRRAVLIVDEAQNLSRDVLEQLRLLTNLETETTKLLQIILIGQPELRQTLSRGDLRQLAQRITGRYHLETLSLREAAGYIRHRLEVAGATAEIFTMPAIVELHRHARGVPRLINVLCDRALLGAYTAEQHQVDRRIARRAIAEVSGIAPAQDWRPWLGGVGVAALAALAFVGLWNLGGGGEEEQPAAAVQKPAAVAAVEVPVPAAVIEAEKQQAEPAAATPFSAVAAPVAAAPAAPALDTLLQAAGDDTATDAAFRNLFAHWNLTLDASGPQPCRQAERLGLKCEYQLGSWTLLRAMNRPAILSLVDSNGGLHHAVISELAQDRARLQLGAEAREFGLAEIAPLWFGEYLVMWRPHPGASELMLPGTSGEHVAWLRESLAAVQGAAANGATTGNTAYYDQSLAREVRRFQRSQKLKADGKAGVQTLIALNTALALGETPLLRPQDEGGN